MTTFAPTAARASELARCPRMCALRMRGETPVEHDEMTRRYFARGHLYSDYVCRQLEAKHGKDNVLREVEVEWPLGTGHADAFVIPDALLVEVKSTVTPTLSSPMFDMAVEQLRIYLRYYDPAEQAALILINPSDLSSEQVFQVGLAEGDVDRIDAVVELIAAGELPERVCAKPSQAKGRLCDFAVPCFEGWEPDDYAVNESPAVVAAARRLYEAKQKIAAGKGELREAEEEKKAAEGELADLVDVGATATGPWLVTRTHVRRQPTFSVKAALAAGYPAESLERFMQPGAEYDTWRVDKATTPTDIDFGDDAPF